VLEAEQDNLRSALASFLADPDGSDDALRLGLALSPFWADRAPAEGLDWLETLVLSAGDRNPQLRAAALTEAAYLQMTLGQAGPAAHTLARARTLIADPNSALMRRVLVVGSHVTYRQGDLDASRDLCEQGLALASVHQDALLAVDCLSGLAQVLTDDGDLEQGIRCFEDALARARLLGDVRSVAFICCNKGTAEQARGHLDAAEELYLEARELGQPLHNLQFVSSVAANLAELSLERFEQNPTTTAVTEASTTAKKYLHEALAAARQSGDELILTRVLEAAAGCAFYAGDYERSAMLYGAADALIDKLSFVREAAVRTLWEEQTNALGEIMTAAAFETAYVAGTQTPPSEAIALAADLQLQPR
jgi:Tetratricopeptide repeat